MCIRDSAYRSEGGAWWARYQPQDYRLIQNPLGDTTSFRNMVTALRAKGIDVYADVVLNHICLLYTSRCV